MAKMGRPKAEIDNAELERLCEMQCTRDEICYFFRCSAATLNRRCREEFGETFDSFSKKRRVAGKVSLRRAQYQSATNGNVTMLIWLGKQYLGQRDVQMLTLDEPSAPLASFLEAANKALKNKKKPVRWLGEKDPIPRIQTRRTPSPQTAV